MRGKITILVTVLCISFFFTGAGQAGEKLMIMCGAAFKMPMEEIVDAFMKQTGAEVNVSYAAVGPLMSQITLSRRGDVFIAPSPDIMNKAEKRGHVIPRSTRNMGYFVPSINVQKGNPKGIKSLKDMTKPGVRIALANPETVFVGMLGVEIVDKGLSSRERELFRKNIVTYAEDFSKLAALLALEKVDAIIGFGYLKGWFPDKIDTVKLRKEEILRIGVGQAALLNYTENRPLAERFLGFLDSKESRDIFKKYHYFATLEEAGAWIGASKPVGGGYLFPRDWMEN
ncbi:MAG TPA: molybdate ABC transporter substrate-binding protein [Syntrophales bacterium]|nr:molybdate ABC transporter substrate-binding protein [Syntrophales bacterium]HPX56880.1 molybdate ABC transporter substrate-binding protein [Syntrophales bacterium]